MHCASRRYHFNKINLVIFSFFIWQKLFTVNINQRAVVSCEKLYNHWLYNAMISILVNCKYCTFLFYWNKYFSYLLILKKWPSFKRQNFQFILCWLFESCFQDMPMDWSCSNQINKLIYSPFVTLTGLGLQDC